jgi:hypothetical protein
MIDNDGKNQFFILKFSGFEALNFEVASAITHMLLPT